MSDRLEAVVWLPLLEAAEFALRAIDSKDPQKYARMLPGGKLVYAADELERQIAAARDRVGTTL